MLVLAVLAFSLFSIESEAKKYGAHDRVAAVANTVGPFNNPTETYPVRIIANNKIFTIIHLIPCTWISTTLFNFVPAPVNNESTSKTWGKLCQGLEKLPPHMKYHS